MNGGTVDTLTLFFNGLRRNCETGQWEDIDVACPGLAEPFRSRVKAVQAREQSEGALLFASDGSVLVRRERGARQP